MRSPEIHFGLDVASKDQKFPVNLRYRDREGRPGALTLQLQPGWYTILLPDAAETLESRAGVIDGGQIAVAPSREL